MTTHSPANLTELCEIVSNACASGGRLEIGGGFTRAAFGAPAHHAERLCLRRFSGIISYDPAELVLTAGAGTPLAEVQAVLAQQRQHLAFDPFGAAGATIGGVIGSAAAGPRRVSAGSVRDHLLGFEAVSGRGERFIAGAKVVKNVTGYDLPKLMCGAWGRLAVLTEVTLKVLPRPPERQTLAWQGLADDAGFALMAAALRLPADVAAAAYLPAGEETPSLCLLRLEGIAPSISARAARLRLALQDYGTVETLAAARADSLWAGLSCGAALHGDLPLWRISLPPSRSATLAARFAALGGRWMADWAGGLIWLALDGHEAVLRDDVQAAGGHATLAHGPASLRARIPALHPPPPGLAALARRIRRAFDPLGVFETGRFLDDPHAD